MEIKEKKFGLLSNGEKVKLYTLTAGDLQLSITDFGATWTSLIVPSCNAGKADVLLGYSGLEGFLNNGEYFGVTVGRFANRIKDAVFSIDGKEYRLEANNGKNSLHSGSKCFAKKLWKSEAYEEDEGVYVRFEINSPDGDSGFPGNLKAVVKYGLTKSNELICDYQASADTATPVNLTNHAYFNLKGEGQGNILSHEVVLYSSYYVEVDKLAIPTGKLLSVKDTAFDFLKRKRIDADFGKISGYDHCFVTDGERGTLRPCAEVYENESGRIMKVFTTQPGVQFYTGNFLNGVTGKPGSVYKKHSGFCLETQHFPDTPNQPGFPQCTIDADNPYHEKAVFAFDW